MLGAVSAVSPLPTAGCRLQFAALCRLSRFTNGAIEPFRTESPTIVLDT